MTDQSSRAATNCEAWLATVNIFDPAIGMRDIARMAWTAALKSAESETAGIKDSSCTSGAQARSGAGGDEAAMAPIGLEGDRVAVTGTRTTAVSAGACTTDPAPKTSLPTWGECALRVGNSNAIEKRVREGGYGADHDVPLATQLHRFIYEYDDADPYKSAWFLHRLELVIEEAKKNSVASATAASDPYADAWNESCPRCGEPKGTGECGWPKDCPVGHNRSSSDSGKADK